MATPIDAPYKLRQREYEKRIANLGRYIPSNVYVEYDRTLKVFVTYNRALRRKLGLV